MNKLLYCLSLTLIFLVLSNPSEGHDMSIKPQQRQILYPTVKVECRAGTGSGVAFTVLEGSTYILTAKHVVDDCKGKIRVTNYPDNITRPAELVTVDPEHDLALLRVETEYKYLALLPKKRTFEPMTPVWKSGAALGHDPFVTKGLLAEVDQEYVMTSTPIAGGDSGGGLWVKEGKDYVILGIIVATPTENKKRVNHMCYGHSMEAIMGFLINI